MKFSRIPVGIKILISLAAGFLIFKAAIAGEDHSLVVAKGAAPVPVGIYVMVRSSQLLDNKNFGEKGLVKILKRPWVSAISLGLNWDVIFPEENRDSFEQLNAILAIVRSASAEAGRKAPIPIFLKVYPVLPSWMVAPVSQADGKAASSFDSALGHFPSSDGDSLKKNKLGMTIIARSSRKDATGREIPGRNYPISTDLTYQKQIYKVMEKLSKWLESVDTDADEIRVLHVIGPGMESNTMRPLAGSIFLTNQSAPENLNWNKEALIKAWINVTTKMSDFAAFRKRCWVFNMTNLHSGRGGSKGFGLTLDDQLRVVNALRDAHPLGRNAVLLKTEDLTVDFNAVAGKFNPLRKKALWRDQYLKSDEYPYRYIASMKRQHGWELWASFYNSRDKRSTSLYPISQLIENSLYSDLESENPHIPQATLWVEIWPDEILRSSEIMTGRRDFSFDNQMQYWNDKLVELVSRDSEN